MSRSSAILKSATRVKGKHPNNLAAIMAESVDETGKRWSVLRLARRLEVAPQSVWAWIHGISMPRASVLFELSRVLNTTPDKLWPHLTVS